MARRPWHDFVMFNAVGAAVWAGTFTTPGFVFGRAISMMIRAIVHYETELVLLILAAGLLWLAAWRLRMLKRSGRT